MMGDRIKAARLSLKMSQNDLAQIMNITRATVSLWESGNTKNMRPENLLNLSRALGESLEYLVFGKHGQVAAANSLQEQSGSYGSIEAGEIVADKWDELPLPARHCIWTILACYLGGNFERRKNNFPVKFDRRQAT